MSIVDETATRTAVTEILRCSNECLKFADEDVPLRRDTLWCQVIGECGRMPFLAARGGG